MCNFSFLLCTRICSLCVFVLLLPLLLLLVDRDCMADSLFYFVCFFFYFIFIFVALPLHRRIAFQYINSIETAHCTPKRSRIYMYIYIDAQAHTTLGKRDVWDGSYSRLTAATSFFHVSHWCTALFHSPHITIRCLCLYISIQIYAYVDTYIYLNITYYVVKVHYFSNFVLLIVRALCGDGPKCNESTDAAAATATAAAPIHIVNLNTLIRMYEYTKRFQPVFSFAQNL